ncbi:MAG: PaaI family thioesterase [Thermodesulfobacteriota bacterium]|nr:PaaI family thioesterase [Thermodesulfobacteriota bacterium]
MPEYEELEPHFKDVLIETMKTKAPFWRLLGMELVDVKKGWAKVRLPFDKKLTHPLEIAHGGAIFSPADSAIAMALMGLVKRDEIFTTVEMKMNYLKPFAGGEITAEAKIIHQGNTIALGEVDVANSKGTLIAKGFATYMIMKKPNAQ